MINYLLGLTAISAFGLSRLIDSAVLSYLCLALSVIWFLCLLIDVFKIRSELNNSDFGNNDGFFCNQSDYYTSLVYGLGELITQRRNQLIVQQAQINHTLSSKTQNETLQTLRAKISEIFLKLNEEAAFFQDLNALYLKCSHADAVVISVKESKQVYSHYISYDEIPAFRTLLDEFAETLLDATQEQLSNIEKIFMRKFAAYGYTDFYVRQIKINHKFCLLWSGYRDQKKPAPNSLLLMQQFVTELEDLLKTNNKLFSLAAEAEKAKQSQNLNSDYIVHLSHDLRSPLNNVKSILHLLESAVVAKDEGELIVSALENCERVHEIVSELLEFSKLNTGNLTSKKHVFNLVACVNQIVSAYKIPARAKGLDLQIMAPESLAIEADKGQIKRVIQNLISNAIKYTDHGHVQIVVRAISAGRLGLKVMDTGRGLKPEQVQTLFQPFKRFHTDVADGIGLGLVLTKALVELNGGEIKVVSNEKQGTTFSVNFPASEKEISFAERILEEQEQANLRLVNAENIDEPKAATGKRVLLLDDDHEYVRTLARSLELSGLTIFQAFSVDQAISIFNYEQPDLIISDNDVPTGGVQRLLELVNKSYKPCPVIVLTGNDDHRIHKNLKASGALSVYVKPVEISELIKAVEQVQEFKSVG